MFGTTVVYELTFSIVNFMKSYYSSSISKGNLVFELGYAVSVKYKPNFENIKKECTVSH